MPIPTNTKYRDFFYRYRHFDDEKSIQSLEGIILNNELHLSSPLSFNDPYDCRPHFVTQGTDREIRAYFKERARDSYPNATKGDINALTTKLLRNFNSSQAFETDFETKYYNELVPTAGMICLTKVPDNILMWSHYASSHSGICLQFEANVDVKSIFLFAFEVIYTTDFPVINYFTCPKEEILDKGLLTKAKDWEYEKEYRIIQDVNVGKILFPAESLTGIIFGLKTTTAHKELVLDWISRRNKKTKLYQAKMKQRQYGIDVVDFRQ